MAAVLKVDRLIGGLTDRMLAEVRGTPEHVVMRLDRWGECLRVSPSWGLGLASEANFLSEHFSGVSDAGLLTGMPADVEEVESIMVKLKMYNDRHFRAVTEYYLFDKGVALAARRMGVSEKTFKVYKACGENFVAGHLSQ